MSKTEPDLRRAAGSFSPTRSRRSTTDWCVKNLVFHRDLELTTISKYMKNASVRFFSIEESHQFALSAAASYAARPPCHFNSSPCNIFTDSPDVLTNEIERLIEINKQNKN
ncbi:hypothetical protein EVAR_71315_1 [Eumeta japonica]|uniref:Uncharacterized protein n=1 Tax=Eumeta variegata TaxID=151549 RepID=A0A4C2A5T3_EUMVA|nr:hypothetical protein EVAR_71315_1 [Eumeta japonica]